MSLDDRLSRIDTMWSMVRRAHADQTMEVHRAQEELLDRYGGAIRRYLLGAMRDENAADEVFQEFSLRFVRGDFHRANPEIGRFRSFLKTTLFRLVVDYHRRRKRNAAGEIHENVEPVMQDDAEETGQLFEQSWRDELLKRAWAELPARERDPKKPLFHALKLRVQDPDAETARVAEQLSKTLDKQVTPANMRVMIFRARERFADILLDEVVQTLKNPTRDSLEQELVDLKLLEYCRPALDRRQEDKT